MHFGQERKGVKCLNSQIFTNEISISSRENVYFEHCDFFNSTQTYSHFKEIKIYSIGFNYSLVANKIVAICLLKMTLEHSSAAYFQVILAHFQ